MGACSSKPKTTEFEGSTEPSKEADRSIDAVDAAQISQQNESGKEERGNDAVAEAVQETHELIASKDEEPLMKGLLTTEGGVSHSVQVEAGAFDGKSGNSATEMREADAGDVQKVDVGVAAADIEEVSDKATTVDKGVGGDQDKLFEDKAVVLDEAGVGRVGLGDPYVDKKVAADEEKAQDSGSILTQDEQSRNLQDINESPGAESPIIGVIHCADPIHVDDVSESVGLATLETPAHVDPPVSESLVETERDVSAGTNRGGDGIALTEAADLSSGPPEEAPEEKEEVLHDNSKGSPLLVSISGDGVGPERGTKDAGEEVPLASADVQDEMSVEDTTKLETIAEPRNDMDERLSEPQEEYALQESARETHADVMENEGNAEVVDEPEPEALKVAESIDAEASTEPKAKTTLEEATEGQDKGAVNEPNVTDVQPPALAIEEPDDDGKPETTPDEAVAEPSAEKLEEPHIEEAVTNEEKVESVDAGNLGSLAEKLKNASGEGDLAFEDASDLPLKVESSTVE